jgi:hypothetical protein
LAASDAIAQASALASSLPPLRSPLGPLGPLGREVFAGSARAALIDGDAESSAEAADMSTSLLASEAAADASTALAATPPDASASPAPGVLASAEQPGRAGTAAAPSASPGPAGPGHEVASRARARDALRVAAREAGDAYALRGGGNASVDLGDAGHLAVHARRIADQTFVHVDAERGATARILADHGKDLARELSGGASVVVSGPGTTASFGREGSRDQPRHEARAEGGSSSSSNGGRRDGGRPDAGGAPSAEDAVGPTTRSPIVAGRRVRIVL